MLEVFDWLCLDFRRGILGTLLLEVLFFPHCAYNYVQPTSASPGVPTACLRWHKVAQLVFYEVITAVYMLFHSMALFYYMVTLNMAINLYDYSLLTLLLSNQFADIKSNVFKWFEMENLF
ncbi:hypothetical protein H4R35_001717 [Dimargaris xerosporica]|nr:hypothetical protein H4R35_001717 [Dimargaris xerosporica]